MGKLSSILKLSPLLAAAALFTASAAPLTCIGSAVIPIVHAEGVTERIGDIVLQCSGGTPGQQVGGNFTVFLNAPVTNRVSADNFADAVLTIDTGNGAVSSGVSPFISGPSQLTFNNVNFTISPAGTATLRFANIRVAANALPLAGNGIAQPVQSAVSFTGNTLVQITAYQPVAYPQISLLTSTLDRLFCPQVGSILPSSPTFASVLTSLNSTTRVTEAFATAFQPRQPGEDNGTRIIARYSSFPAGSTILVPDVIVGSTGFQPTSAGQFNVTASGGQYIPGSGTLLLVRVLNTDANGAGGTLAVAPPAASATPVSFNTVSSVPLTNGAGMAVYEVVDANPNTRESAQIPTFFGFPPIEDPTKIPSPQQSLLLGPISTAQGPSQTAPIPRFIGGSSGEDCVVNNDCGADFRAHLSADIASVTLDAPSGGPQLSRIIRLHNSGQAPMYWSTKIAYKSGSDWLIMSPSSGVDDRNVVFGLYPGKLAQGSYDAVVTFDAGTAGSLDVPVHMNVTAAAPPAPKVTSLTNAATFLAGPVVAGSLVTIKGSNLNGAPLSVTFDGKAANVLYSSPGQLNVQIPADLGNATSTQLLVSANGATSTPMSVSLVPAAPGIFNPGILNQDSSVNTADNPALAGSIIQIFTTGLMGADGAEVDVKIHDRAGLKPIYAGPAPGIPGVQQVNVVIPADLPPTTSDIWVCATVDGQRYCSPSAKLSIRR